MKRLSFLMMSLALVYSASAQSILEIAQEQVCWSTPGGADSSLTRYVLISTRVPDRPRTLCYVDENGQIADVSGGGSFTQGFCGCCAGGSGSGSDADWYFLTTDQTIFNPVWRSGRVAIGTMDTSHQLQLQGDWQFVPDIFGSRFDWQNTTDTTGTSWYGLLYTAPSGLGGSSNLSGGRNNLTLGTQSTVIDRTRLGVLAFAGNNPTDTDLKLSAFLDAVADGAWTGSNTASHIDVWVTAPGETFARNTVTFQGDGRLELDRYFLFSDGVPTSLLGFNSSTNDVSRHVIGGTPAPGSAIVVNGAGSGLEWSQSNNGNVLYVNKTAGNNATAIKGSRLKPWRDPWAARDAAVAGDLIYVYDSQFTLDWRVTNSGDWSTGSMSLSKDRVKFYFHNVKITNTGSYEPGVVGCGVTNRPFLFTTNSLAYIRDTSSWIKSRRYYVDIKGHNFVLKDMAAFLHVTPNGGADIITGVPAFPLGLPVPDLYVNLEIDSIVMKHSGMVVITGDDINFKGDIKNAVFDGPDIGFSAQSGCLQTNVFTIAANPNRTPFDSIRVNLRVDNVYAFMTSYGSRGLFNLHDEITAPSATKFLAQCDLNLDIGKVVYFTNSAAGDIGSLIDFTHAGRYFKSNININIDQAESFMPVQYDSLVKARYVPYLQPNRTTGTMIGFGTPLDSTTVTIHCNQCIAYDNAIQLYDGFGTTHKRGKVVITGNYHSKNFQTVLFDQVVNNASDCDYILSGTFTSDRREVFQCSGTQQSRVLFKNSLLKTYANFPVIASRKGVFLLDATLEKQAGAEALIWSDVPVTHMVGGAFSNVSSTDADVTLSPYEQLAFTPTSTNLSYTGSGPVTLNSSTGSDVTITGADGISVSATPSNITISETAYTSDTIALSGAWINIFGVQLTALKQSSRVSIQGCIRGSVIPASGTISVTNSLPSPYRLIVGGFSAIAVDNGVIKPVYVQMILGNIDIQSGTGGIIDLSDDPSDLLIIQNTFYKI